MSGRRLIGIDLAWGEKNGSGCVELAWEGRELRLERVDWLRSMDDIVEWIDPQRGEWMIAIDAPLVVRNAVGRRYAEAEIDDRYRPFEAGAQPSNLTNSTLGGKDYRGGRLRRLLEGCGGDLVERSEDVRRESDLPERFVLETYPHAAMVELFDLEKTFKYKRVRVDKKSAGQQEAAEAIRKHFCAESARPRLVIERSPDSLEELLREPARDLRGADLNRRGDELDALVCAYVAAWVDCGAPFRAFGKIGEGVIIVPWALRMREGGGWRGAAFR